VDQEANLARVLAEFAHTLVADFSIAETLDHLVSRTVEALPVTGAGIVLIGDEREPCIVAASDERVEELEALQNELHEGPCLTAFSSDQPVLLPDLSADGGFPRYSGRARGKGLAAVFAFPLRVEGCRLGALDLYRDSPGPLSDADLAAADVLAGVAAAYLFNARMRSIARESERELRHRSLHDALTGLPNRTLFEERLEQAVRRGTRSDRMAALLFVDLDEFKSVNDRFGHQLGDELLTRVASRLASIVRPGDTLARLAGDEFAILCEDLSDPAQGEAIARRVSAVLSTPLPCGGHLIAVTASVGVAFSGPESQIPSGLLRDADVAMYQAKRAGGAQHRVLDHALKDDSVLDLRTDGEADSRRSPAGLPAGFAPDLEEALEQGRLRLAYQPIVDPSDGSVCAVECLPCWRDPDGGWLEPRSVSASAERTGLVNAVGSWALTSACRDLQGWRRRYGASVVPGLSVNVSAGQVLSPGFVDTVLGALSETGIDPASFQVEVSESLFVENGQRAAAVLGKLRDLGVGVALDEFGSGYASLAHLTRFRFDAVKVDRAFTADLGSGEAAAIVAAVVNLAHAMALTVIADGVEREGQLAELIALGTDRVQGRYLCPPLPRQELEQQILRGAAGEQPVRLPLAGAASREPKPAQPAFSQP
jgi:diguanylate cyclase (GGDEF)-like protein